jgi:hypothetical protein
LKKEEGRGKGGEEAEGERFKDDIKAPTSA